MYRLIATTATGLEAVVKREAIKLGLNDISVEDGKVYFTGNERDIVRANLWLRSAGRILLVMKEFTATTFEELFDFSHNCLWEEFLPKDANFIISCSTIKSKLSSEPACQKIVEKAIIKKLQTKYDIERFPKTGDTYKIKISLQKNRALLTIDTSGTSLAKRGYRLKSVEAPIKETLAAGLIDLSYWKRDRTLLDGVCGSGTILIEAALIARNIAPGLNRKFAAEYFNIIPSQIWKDERKKAFAAIDQEYEGSFFGSDIDEQAIKQAEENAYNAGVDDLIKFQAKPFNEVVLPCDYGVAISNPPYGERIGILEEVHQLYRDMGKLFSNPTWSVYVITSDEEFEKFYGKPADKKRKLYNARIKTDYYQYYGKRPEKN